MTWLTDTLIATGALIALVLVLRRPVARLCGPGMAYALWALPLLRLALPPLVLPQQPVPAAPVLALAQRDTAPALPVVAEAAIPWFEIASAVWLLGALAFIVWRLAGYRAMRRQLLRGARPVGEIGAVRLVETPGTQAPVAFGVRDKVIALPLDFMARQDRRGRDLAIAHELEHHCGRDLAVNLAMQPLMALHWFNPLAWAGWRALRRDQEAACDARVLAGADAATRAAYARLIASFAHSPRLALAAPMACPVLGEKSIVHRLRSLTMTQPTPQRRRLGRFGLAAAVLALPLSATITYAAADDSAAKVERTVQVKRKVVVIDAPGGAAIDDASLHTRVIERDGNTIVFKTRQPLSDAELEQRLARIDWAPPAPPLAPTPPLPPAAAMAPEPPAAPAAPLPPSAAPAREVSTVIRHSGHEGHDARCTGGDDDVDVDVDTEAAGERHRIRIKLCDVGKHARAEALAGLREARAEVAADPEIPANVRSDVLKGLDAEIDRLSKEG